MTHAPSPKVPIWKIFWGTYFWFWRDYLSPRSVLPSAHTDNTTWPWSWGVLRRSWLLLWLLDPKGSPNVRGGGSLKHPRPLRRRLRMICFAGSFRKCRQMLTEYSSLFRLTTMSLWVTSDFRCNPQVKQWRILLPKVQNLNFQLNAYVCLMSVRLFLLSDSGSLLHLLIYLMANICGSFGKFWRILSHKKQLCPSNKQSPYTATGFQKVSKQRCLWGLV